MNCLEPAPEIYRTFIHSIQIFSVPTYFLALISLIFIKSNVFTTYRIFLIWHVLENASFEVFSAYLVEPALHAPYTLMRATGSLSRVGVGGMLQALILCLGIEYNGVSITEMFWFRYKVSILHYKDHIYTYFIRFLVYTTRCIAVVVTLFSAVTYNDALRFQQFYKSELLKLNPQHTFLTCDSVYILAATEHYVSSVFVVFWILQAIVVVISVLGIAIFIRFSMPKTMSEVTWKVQQLLLRSLVIQASIHVIMLGGPALMLIHAFLNGYENEAIGYGAFVCMTYHGFASSLAMIIFTKPLRQYLAVLFKLKKTVKSPINSLNKRASFISVPTYLLALVSLIFIKSNVFTTYRIFLIWHILENFMFEIYSAYLVEPVLHAPYTLMRATGLLSKFGVGGLVQTLILCLGIEYNGASISEMFWFRYKSSIINYKEHNFTYLLRLLVNSTRFIAVFDTVFCTITYSDGLRFQQNYKAELLELNTSHTFLLCDSVSILAAFKDYVSTVFCALWILQSIVLLISVPGSALFISFNIPKTVSEVTLKVQQQLLKSLIIQASIHGFMLGVPNLMFIYAFLFGYENETIAYVAFVCLAYHGFASALAMIIFTKPLRQYLAVLFKFKKTVASKTSITSVKRASVFS